MTNLKKKSKYLRIHSMNCLLHSIRFILALMFTKKNAMTWKMSTKKQVYDSTSPRLNQCPLSYGSHQIAPSESFLGLKIDSAYASSTQPWTRLVGERQSTPKLICHPFALLQSTSFCRCLGNCSGKDSGIVKIVALCKGNITRLPSSLKSHPVAVIKTKDPCACSSSWIPRPALTLIGYNSGWLQRSIGRESPTLY